MRRIIDMAEFLLLRNYIIFDELTQLPKQRLRDFFLQSCLPFRTKCVCCFKRNWIKLHIQFYTDLAVRPQKTNTFAYIQ